MTGVQTCALPICKASALLFGYKYYKFTIPHANPFLNTSSTYYVTLYHKHKDHPIGERFTRQRPPRAQLLPWMQLQQGSKDIPYACDSIYRFSTGKTNLQRCQHGECRRYLSWPVHRPRKLCRIPPLCYRPSAPASPRSEDARSSAVPRMS